MTLSRYAPVVHALRSRLDGDRADMGSECPAAKLLFLWWWFVRTPGGGASGGLSAAGFCDGAAPSVPRPPRPRTAVRQGGAR